MNDIKDMTRNPEKYIEAMENRGMVSSVIIELLSVNKELNSHKRELEAINAIENTFQKKHGKLLGKYNNIKKFQRIVEEFLKSHQFIEEYGEDALEKYLAEHPDENYPATAEEIEFISDIENVLNVLEIITEYNNVMAEKYTQIEKVLKELV